MNYDLASAIAASADRLGISPLDLGTVISYETAGTFDPWKRGPTTKWGTHRGLFQWGEPQAQRYGVRQGMPVEDQLRAGENYLRDAGFKPGMGILDLYSAINAGRVGRYGARDAAQGGAPGTVRDKVERQMGPHRQKAASLLEGAGIGSMYAQNLPTPPTRPAADQFSTQMADTPELSGIQDLAMLYQAASAGPQNVINQVQQDQTERRQMEETDALMRRQRLRGQSPIARLFTI